MVTSTCLALALLTQDPLPTEIREFTEAVSRRSYDIVGPQDPALLGAMQVVADSVRRRTLNGVAPSETWIQPFQLTLPGATSATDYRSLDLHIAQDKDRFLVSVRMGGASYTGLFARKSGGWQNIPEKYEWLSGYRVEGFFLPSGGLLLNCERVQDMGMRYGYVVDWLKQTPNGYFPAGTAKGSWVLDDKPHAHLALKGDTATLKTLDDPYFFQPVATQPLFERTAVWTTKNGEVDKTSEALRQGPLRIVDQWLARALKSAKPTALEAKAKLVSRELVSPHSVTLSAGKQIVTIPNAIFTLGGPKGNEVTQITLQTAQTAKP